MLPGSNHGPSVPRFFTSDTHFGDARILRSAKRPFSTIEDHDRHLVARWREVVTDADEVWHLGDFAPGYSSAAISALLGGLPGRKHLIAGNNDDEVTRAHCGWTSVQDYIELDEGGEHCVLCHYPFRTWNKMGKGVINLHGHSHNALKPLTRQVDVGVDAWAYAPTSLATIMTSRRFRRKQESG